MLGVHRRCDFFFPLVSASVAFFTTSATEHRPLLRRVRPTRSQPLPAVLVADRHVHVERCNVSFNSERPWHPHEYREEPHPHPTERVIDSFLERMAVRVSRAAARRLRLQPGELRVHTRQHVVAHGVHEVIALLDDAPLVVPSIDAEFLEDGLQAPEDLDAPGAQPRPDLIEPRLDGVGRRCRPVAGASVERPT